MGPFWNAPSGHRFFLDDCHLRPSECSDSGYGLYCFHGSPGDVFVTPIIWPQESAAVPLPALVIHLNPFYHLLEVIRHPLLRSEPATAINYLVVLMTIVFLVIVAWILTKWYIGRIAYLL